jgi:hypothetical protein
LNTEHPLREAIEALTQTVLPKNLRHQLDYCVHSEELSDRVFVELQDFCSLNANPSWATGGAMLDSANLIVEQAIENGNIRS